jgi:hypothetical protein
MANNDPSSLVRSSAIEALGRLKKPQYRELFLNAINDSSYAIAGSGLSALGNIDTLAALDRARALSSQKMKARLTRAVNNILYSYAGENDFDSLAAKFERLPIGNNKFSILQPFAGYLKRIKNETNFRKGVDLIAAFRDSVPKQYGEQLMSYINGVILNGIASAKQSAGLTSQSEYVKSKLVSGNETKAPAVDIPVEILQKYEGEYTYEQGTLKVVLRNSKTLFLVVSGQQEMEFIPVTKSTFNVKFMNDYKVEFLMNEKGEVTTMKINVGEQEIKADRKK